MSASSNPNGGAGVRGFAAPYALATEQTVTINTAAAGGNATLLSGGE